jgi:hypothetical protein
VEGEYAFFCAGDAGELADSVDYAIFAEDDGEPRGGVVPVLIVVVVLFHLPAGDLQDLVLLDALVQFFGLLAEHDCLYLYSAAVD